MKLLIAGGDARAAYAAQEADRRALAVSALGLENSPLDFPRASWEDVSQADAVLMANPWRTPFPGPLGEAIDAAALMNALRPDARLVFPDVLKMPASFTRSWISSFILADTTSLEPRKLPSSGTPSPVVSTLGATS